MHSFMPNQFQLNQLKWQLSKCQVIDLTRIRLLRVGGHQEMLDGQLCFIMVSHWKINLISCASISQVRSRHLANPMPPVLAAPNNGPQRMERENSVS